jgi:hypothetical protein
MLTTSVIRFVWVPIVLVLQCCDYGTTEKKLSNVLRHPEVPSEEHEYPKGQGLGTCGPVTMSNAIHSLLPQGTHDEGGRTFVQLVTHSDQLMTDT